MWDSKPEAVKPWRWGRVSLPGNGSEAVSGACASAQLPSLRIVTQLDAEPAASTRHGSGFVMLTGGHFVPKNRGHRETPALGVEVSGCSMRQGTNAAPVVRVSPLRDAATDGFLQWHFSV